MPDDRDFDIVLFGDRQVAEPGLTIPHPELLRRVENAAMPEPSEPLPEVAT